MRFRKSRIDLKSSSEGNHRRGIITFFKSRLPFPDIFATDMGIAGDNRLPRRQSGKGRTRVYGQSENGNDHNTTHMANPQN
jgi:hypothetical protein